MHDHSTHAQGLRGKAIGSVVSFVVVVVVDTKTVRASCKHNKFVQFSEKLAFSKPTIE